MDVPFEETVKETVRPWSFFPLHSPSFGTILGVVAVGEGVAVGVAGPGVAVLVGVGVGPTG
jgi:hypothetical protein